MVQDDLMGSKMFFLIRAAQRETEENPTSSSDQKWNSCPKATAKSRMKAGNFTRLAVGNNLTEEQQENRSLAREKHTRAETNYWAEIWRKEQEWKPGNENPWRHLNGKTEERSSAGSGQRHELNQSHVPTKLGAGW
jgi:hypothetical protein